MINLFRCLLHSVGALAVMIATPSCSDPYRPEGLEPLNPNSRSSLGQSSVDSTGRKVAALPPGRPVREISVYDFVTGAVDRFVDPDTQADYSHERVAISRDGATIFAIRHYYDLGRYPDLVAIDVETRTITKLHSNAAGFWSLAPDSTGRYLFYFRDVADRLESLDGNSKDRMEPRLDHSAPGPYRQLARYDLQARREDLQSTLIFEDAALLTATSRHLIFSVKNTFPDFKAEYEVTKQGEAFRRFVNEQTSLISSADPPDVDRRNLDLYRTTLPISPPEAAPIVRVKRARAVDFGLSIAMAEPDEFESGRLQMSDDEHVLLGTVRSGEYCWGTRLSDGDTACRRIDGNPMVNLRVTMSFDGASTILSKAAPATVGGVTWCRISYGRHTDDCHWQADSAFRQRVVSLKDSKY